MTVESQGEVFCAHCFSHKALRRALRMLDAPKALGEHPLAYLNVVKAQCGADFESNSLKRGNVLRETLYLAIEDLRPEVGPDLTSGLELDFGPGSDNARWFPYFIVTKQYLERKSPTFLAQHMYLGRATYFKAQQRALDLLAAALQQVEQGWVESLGADSPPPFLAPPRPVYTLVGRDRLLGDLKRRLFDDEGSPLVALSGLPGVGKTALAVELAYDPQVLDYFGDGVLWAGLGRHPDVLALLGTWGVALGVSSDEMAGLSTVDERVRRVQAAIGARRMLLVIDDAWQAEAAFAFKVGGGNCAYLLTTRIPEVALAFAGDDVISVPELSEADSAALLSRMAPQAMADEPDTVRTLIHAAGGLPLALALMGWYLRKETHSGVPRRLHRALERLQQTEMRLHITQPQTPLERHPDVAAGTPLSLQTIISISDEALPPDARQALRALSVLPPKPNTHSEAAALAVIDGAPAVLNTLTDRGLLEVNSAGRYTLHQTIADYAGYELAQDADAQRCARERMVAFFVEYAEAHGRKFPVLEAEFDNIVAVLEMAFEHGMQAALVRMTNACSWFLVDTRSRALIEKYHERAERAARALGDARLLAYTLHNLAYARHRQGAYEQARALLNEELSLAEDDDDLEIILRSLLILGAIATTCGDNVQAKEIYSRAFAKTTKGDRGYAVLLGNLGLVTCALGQVAEGVAYMEEALAEHHRVGNHNSESLCLINLSDVHLNIGCVDEAAGYAQQAVSVSREAGNRKHESMALNNVGRVLCDQGEIQQALVHQRQALAVFRTSGDRRHEGMTLGYIAACYHAAGQAERAVEYYQQALQIALEIDDQVQRGEYLGRLGRLYHDMGQVERALEYTEQALPIAAGIHDLQTQSRCLKQMGELYHARGQIRASDPEPGAISYYRQALDIARQIENSLLTGECLGLLSQAYHDLEQDDEALAYAQQALEALEGVSSSCADRVREEVGIFSSPC